MYDINTFYVDLEFMSEAQEHWNVFPIYINNHNNKYVCICVGTLNVSTIVRWASFMYLCECNHSWRAHVLLHFPSLIFYLCCPEAKNLNDFSYDGVPLSLNATIVYVCIAWSRNAIRKFTIQRSRRCGTLANSALRFVHNFVGRINWNYTACETNIILCLRVAFRFAEHLLK